MPSSKKTAVLIDNGYLQQVLKNDFRGAQINYQRLCDFVCGKYGLERTITYVYDGAPFIPSRPTEVQRRRIGTIMKAHEDMRRLDRFVLRLGKQIPIYDADRIVDYGQKGVDVLLAMEVMLIALDPDKRTDHVVLISGDGDFAPVVRFARTKDVHVLNYHSMGRVRNNYFRNLSSRDLIECCDHDDVITDQAIKECKLGSVSGRPS